jgi:hypothetical protein
MRTFNRFSFILIAIFDKFSIDVREFGPGVVQLFDRRCEGRLIFGFRQKRMEN